MSKKRKSDGMPSRRRGRYLTGGLALAALVLVIMAALSRTPTASLPASTAFATAPTAAVVTSAPATPAISHTAAPPSTPVSTTALRLPLLQTQVTAAAPTAPPTTPSDPPTYSYRVLAVHPHDPDAFTQGLQWIDGELFEGTGLYGRSSLRRVDLETGVVLQQIDLPPQYFGEGITVLNDRIFQLTWREQTGFIHDRTTFDPIGEFTYSTEGWGLTYDGAHLLLSDGSATISRLDPETLAVVGQFQVRSGETPVVRLNELEMVGDELFANIWQTDRIAAIDPASGQVTRWIDLTGLLLQSTYPITGSVDVLNGIAYDAATDRLWVTGKLWPALFQIELIAPLTR